jgi:iron complex transport system substrate-binding protein
VPVDSEKSLGADLNHPRRIVCLSDETLYLLGAQERIVGVSGFSTRPPEVRSKPRISAFRDANFDAIVAVKPDLVLTFSDVQAEITRQLVLRGVSVVNFNQRSIAEILDMIAMLARIVDKAPEGNELVARLQHGLNDIAFTAQKFPHRPTVYFEEWNDPLISGIGWVEELVEIAGGEAIFPRLRHCGKAQDRVVDPDEVLRRDPEVVFASWCGMKVDFESIASRPGWREMCAVRNGHVYEIPSSCILQPGPAALTDGVRLLHEKLAEVARLNDPAKEVAKPERPTSFL